MKRQVAMEINKIRIQYQDRINKTINNVKLLVPKTRIRNRETRALLPFFGKIGHKLFGYATEKDIKTFISHIAELESRDKDTSHFFQNTADKLSSFMQISNQRFENIQRGMKNNHQELSTLATQLKYVADVVTDVFQWTVRLSRELQYAEMLAKEFDNFAKSIQFLVKNIISPTLIPFDQVTKVHEAIENILKTTQQTVTLKPLVAAHFYRDTKFAWTSRGNSIFITVNFPIVNTMSHMHLFQIMQVPSPLNHSTSHVTMLEELPKYVSISMDNRYYAFPDHHMPKSDVASLHLDEPLYSVDRINGVTAIYFDQKELIKAHCNFQVKLNGLQTAIQHVEHGKYIVSDMNDVIINCP